MSMSLKLKQRGDTIVEVLIATAVVSLVLTGAMAVSNNSLKQIRAAQERSEAQAYAQSTVELLDGYTGQQQPLQQPLQQTPFCLNIISGVITNSPVNNINCIFSDRYKQLVTYDQNKKSYTVTITWDGITGNQETLTLAYRTEK